MEPILLREVLFCGASANAFKLGTVLTLGWFWVRTEGCSLLYRGGSMETIAFDNILAVADLEVEQIQPPTYVSHDNNATYFYVVRRVNECGQMEHTLSASVKVTIDADGNLISPRPNDIFEVKAEQLAGNKIQLIWYYCPLEQESSPTRFKVYYDAGTGQIDYENPLATISYTGRKFYSYQSDALDAGTYLFAVRVEDATGASDGSLAYVRIQLDAAIPDAVSILSAEIL